MRAGCALIRDSDSLAVEEETMPNSDPAQTDRPESAPAVPPDEASPQTDCFQVSRVSLLYRYLLLLALTLVGALLLSLLFPMAVSGRDYLIGGLLAIWALALLRYWIFLLSMPHRVCLEGNETLVLHSCSGRRRSHAAKLPLCVSHPSIRAISESSHQGRRPFPCSTTWTAFTT